MQHRPPSPPGPSIPGLGGPPDAARLRLMRRMLAECASLVEDRVFGLPRPASHGALLGGAASRSAVASLASCGLLPASAASDISSAVLAGGLSLAMALHFASDMAESLMSAKVVPLRGSCGPVESALIPGLVRKAAALTAEVAVLDAFAATAAASLASCLGPRRRVAAAAMDVDVMVRRRRRASEDADPDAAVAGYLEDAASGRRSATLVRLRFRRSGSARLRRRPSPKAP